MEWLIRVLILFLQLLLTPVPAATGPQPLVMTTLPATAVALPAAGQPQVYMQLGQTAVNNTDFLATGFAYIPLTFRTENRTSAQNLVFVQRLPDGSTRSAELPRDNVMVPDSGSGILQAVLPAGDPAALDFEVRLVDVASGQVLASGSAQVQVVYLDLPETGVVTGLQCFQPPFAPDQGIAINSEVLVRQSYNAPQAYVFGDAGTVNSIAAVPVGSTLRVVGAAYCENKGDGLTLRSWPVETVAEPVVRGWIAEYTGMSGSGFVYSISPAGAMPPLPEVMLFAVSPSDVLDPNGQVVVEWRTRGAARVTIAVGSTLLADQPAAGTLTFAVRDIMAGTNPVDIWVNAQDAQNNSDQETLRIPLLTDLRIDSFTASPAAVAPGGEVTLSWSASGSLASGYIYWTTQPRPSLVPVGDVVTPAGVLTHTLPAGVYGDTQAYTLVLTDVNGVSISQTATVTVVR